MVFRLALPARSWISLLSVSLVVLTTVPARAAGPGSSAGWTILERTVDQDQGSWQIDYRLRHDGPTGLVLTPTEITAKVEGWVSNSRVASHGLPRLSSVIVSGPAGLSAAADVIASADEAQRCRERFVVRVWTPDGGEGQPDGGSRPNARPAPIEPQPLISVGPGGTVRVRVRLEHQHFLYGDYDPLLGQRSIELTLGAATVRDVVPLDREHYLAQPKYTWPTPPEDRRDTRHFVSGPDSLHLEAHVPGNQYYRYPERPVRYATKMRLRYWYLIAPGTEGECRARIAQYKDTPTAWKVLTEGGHEQCLTAVGRWVKVERIFKTEPDATTLALDFRISGADIGEMWIDDVSLEPIGTAPAGP